MSRYARLAGRKRYPGHRHSCAAHADAGSPPSEKTIGGGGAPATLVAAGVRINGEVKSAISPEILKQTEGMPWHRRCARIHALTGVPFSEVKDYVKAS
jgi:hypothetical protein